MRKSTLDLTTKDRHQTRQENTDTRPDEKRQTRSGFQMDKIHTCSQELSTNFHTAATHPPATHPPARRPTQKGATAASKSSQTWVLTGSCAILLLTRTQMLGGKLSSCSQLVSKRQNLQPQKTTLLFFTSNRKEPLCMQQAENIIFFLFSKVVRYL